MVWKADGEGWGEGAGGVAATFESKFEFEHFFVDVKAIRCFQSSD